MNWYTLFYLFSILNKLTGTINTIAIVSLIGTGVLLIIYYINKSTINESREGNNDYTVAHNWIKTLAWPRRIFMICAIIFGITSIFAPTRKDMIIIIAGGAVGEFIMHDDNAKQLPADITRFLRGEILKATAELTDEAKESIGIDVEAEKIKKLSREELEKLFLEKTKEDKPAQ